MARDPFADLQDAPLLIVPRVLDALRAYRAAPKFGSLPEVDRARLAALLDGLADRLLGGVERQPTRFWVLKQCRQTLDAADGETADARQQVRAELGRLMGILGVGSAGTVLDS